MWLKWVFIPVLFFINSVLTFYYALWFGFTTHTGVFGYIIAAMFLWPPNLYILYLKKHEIQRAAMALITRKDGFETDPERVREIVEEAEKEHRKSKPLAPYSHNH